MAAIREVRQQYLKNSNNEIVLWILEDGDPVLLPGGWTELHLDCRNVATGAHVARISRTQNERGVSLSSGGQFVLNPALIDDDDNLVLGSNYRLYITVVTPSYPNGVVFGADNTRLKFILEVRDPTEQP